MTNDALRIEAVADRLAAMLQGWTGSTADTRDELVAELRDIAAIRALSADRGEAVAWRTILPDGRDQTSWLHMPVSDWALADVKMGVSRIEYAYAATPPSPERVAQLTAHRACCGTEHDPANGKLHGYCIVCGVPWPCEYAGKPPSPAARAEVPKGVWEALQRMIEDGFTRGPASTEDARLVAKWRGSFAAASAAPSGVSDAVRADAYDSWQSIAADMQKIDRLPPSNHPPLSYWKSRVGALADLEAAQPQPGRVEGIVLDPSWKVLAEHSGCGYGTQADQITVRVDRGDKVVLIPAPSKGHP